LAGVATTATQRMRMISHRRRLHRVLLLGHHHHRVTRDRTTSDSHLSDAMHAELLRAVGLEGEALRADQRALILAENPAERGLLERRLAAAIHVAA
jgi:hypothetical protein